VVSDADVWPAGRIADAPARDATSRRADTGRMVDGTSRAAGSAVRGRELADGWVVLTDPAVTAPIAALYPKVEPLHGSGRGDSESRAGEPGTLDPAEDTRAEHMAAFG